MLSFSNYHKVNASSKSLEIYPLESFSFVQCLCFSPEVMYKKYKNVFAFVLN